MHDISQPRHHSDHPLYGQQQYDAPASAEIDFRMKNVKNGWIWAHFDQICAKYAISGEEKRQNWAVMLRQIATQHLAKFYDFMVYEEDFHRVESKSYMYWRLQLQGDALQKVKGAIIGPSRDQDLSMLIWIFLVIIVVNFMSLCVVCLCVFNFWNLFHLYRYLSFFVFNCRKLTLKSKVISMAP